ncbi:MAG: 4Fe-4S binding protein [Planctomycetota bacterium]
MRHAWSAVVFALGFFALVAQALLFRSFLASFEGNELGIGAFFGSWLLWVAAGALLGRAAARRRDLRPTHVALLALVYLPAFVLQDQLIGSARAMTGVAAYELFPLHKMVLASLLANAPTSLVTGFLFTLACRCSADGAVLPVARVYILESLGAFAGGIFVTLLLAGGLPAQAVFLRAGCLLALATALCFRKAKIRRRVRAAGAVPLLVLLVLLVTGADLAWAGARDRATWRRLLADEAYRGSFTTAQGKYLYGEREGQFIVMAWGAVTETLPDTEHASEVAALALAQNPGARQALVIGPGSLALCLRLAAFPQVERVAWFHPDPEYPPALWPVVPERFRAGRAKLEIPDQDVRAALSAGTRHYDLILLNLPDVTTLVLNRYATREFFALLKGALAPGGVVALKTSGGANYLGSELVYLGSSAYETLQSTFEHVVLKPGEESWLLAGDRGAAVTAAPAVLRDRFAAIEGAAALYPPEGLLSLYPPDRIEFQLERYRSTAEKVGADVLRNTDWQPKALLYSLAVALRKAGRRAVARDVALLLAAVARIGVAAVLSYLLLRVVYLLRSPRAAPRPRLFDGAFLVGSTGLVGMSLSVVLMFLFQARYGSLYLHAGLVFSLFMLGVFCGGLLAERLLAALGREPRALLPCFLVAHLGLFALLLVLTSDPSQLAFAGLFVLAGFFTGLYFPVAAHRLRAAGRSAAAAGSSLEMIDHLGGAVGAVLAGLFLLPLLGTSATLALLALLVLANLVPALLPEGLAARSGAADRFEARTRAAGYAAFGVAAWLLVASHLFAAAEAGQMSRRLEAAARELSGTTDLRERSATFGDGDAITYFEVPDGDDGVAACVFATDVLAADVYGYHGPITLALHVDKDGTLRAFRILHSRETPAYLARLEEWLGGLAGRNVFAPDPFGDVDTVSGATMSSKAIVSTLALSGRRFAAEVLGMKDAAAPQPAAGSWGPDRDFVCLALLTVGAILLRYLPRVWLRRLFLAVTLAVTGFLLNLQFSTQHVFGLLSLDPPVVRLTGGFFMVFLVPAVVLLFGNVYCGYVCPFGALQELVGDLRRRRFATDPHPSVWRYGRAVKYALLALLAVLFAWTRDYGVLGADPLITFFGDAGGVFLLGIAAVALSLVFRRFWCRNLCPAGAFLALLNGVTLLRRLLPRAQVGRCDLGVRSTDELDCLRCDRCRHEEE